MRQFKHFIVTAVIVITSCIGNPKPAAAQGGYPLGADVVRGAVESNLVVGLTNPGSITALCSTTVVYGVSNDTQRVRLTIFPDPHLNAFVGYTAGDGTNYLSGTSGWPLPAGGTSNKFVSERPHLWKDAISITVTSSIAASNNATATFPIYDETGSYE